MRSSALWRMIAFAATVAGVIAVAWLSSSAEPGRDRHRQEVHASRTPALLALADVRRREASLRAAARRFLSAFFRVEVGDLSPWVLAELRANATRPFSRSLMDRPLAPGEDTQLLGVGRIHVALLPPRGRRALVSGVAQRRDGPEEFAFLFARHPQRWLATGPAS